MAEEIELKLALPAAAHRAFLRHPLLRQATRHHAVQLTNLYHDTPALALRERGIALRLRAQGKFWLQTVKCAGDRAGGLSARPEWETPYAGRFDFAAVDAPAVRDWLARPKLAKRIAPIFETNFRRIAWVFERPRGTRVELVLDRGWITAHGAREPISEIEIELLAGDPAELFALARELAARVPLAPAPLSKADRGYRLFLQEPAAPSRATPIALDPAAGPLAAFRRIALGCLDHLQRNYAGAIGADDPATREDPEYIHQMRVALRRLRAALRLFAPLLPEGFGARLLPPLHELMAMLGTARDYDVLLTEIAGPVLSALPDEPRLAALVVAIAERRRAIRADALARLGAPHYGEVVLQALAILHGLDANPASTAFMSATDLAPEAKVSNGETAPSAPSLRDFATQRLRRLRKRTLALASRARVDDPASLHALRIGIKRLRYALEFFSPLAAAKPQRRLLAHLAALQDALGQINDLANAGALLMACAGEDAHLREAVTLIGGWHGPRYQRLLAVVPRELKRLGKLRLPELGT